jgi:hypothetical protein
VAALALAHHHQHSRRPAVRLAAGFSLLIEIAQHTLIKGAAQTVECIYALGWFYHPRPTPYALVVFHRKDHGLHCFLTVFGVHNDSPSAPGMVETAFKKLPSPNSCNWVCILTEQDSSQRVLLVDGIMQLPKMMDIFKRPHQRAVNDAIGWRE